MYNNIGDANFTGKYKGIPLKANSISESLIEIVIDGKKVSFKKGDKIAVTKKVQSIINKILNEDESEQKKDNTRIKKFVDSLSSEFKNIKIMPVKKLAPKNTVRKKAVTTRKKITVKKVVAPRKKTTKENIKLDSVRPALPTGRRLSKPQYYKNGALRSEGGKIYYENRLNHADIKQTKKRGQMLGINEEFFDTSVINDIDDLRKQYFKLAKKYHPDTGGTTAQFQKLNDEHERLLKKLLNGSKLNEAEKQNEIEIDEAIKVIIDNIINIQNINIEVVGKWLWISSDTFGFTTPTYNALNSAGLRYIKKGGRPYMIYAGVQSKSKGKMTKEDIDKKYGKTTFTPKKPSSLNGVITNKTKLLSALKKLKKGLDNRPV